MLRVLAELTSELPWSRLPELIVRAHEAETRQERPDADVELRVEKMMYLPSWIEKINTATTPVMSEDYLKKIEADYNSLINNYQTYQKVYGSKEWRCIKLVEDDEVSLDEFLEIISESDISFVDLRSVAPLVDPIREEDEEGELSSYIDRLDMLVASVMRLIRMPTLVQSGCYDEILTVFDEDDLEMFSQDLLKDAEQLVSCIFSASGLESIEEFSRLCREGYLRIDSYIYYLELKQFEKWMTALDDDIETLDYVKPAPKDHVSILEDISEAILGAHRFYDDEWEGSTFLKGFILRNDNESGLIGYVALYMSVFEMFRGRSSFDRELMLLPVDQGSYMFNRDYATYRYHLDRLKPVQAKSARS